VEAQEAALTGAHSSAGGGNGSAGH
jgi:hypothetical protein